MLGVAVSTIKYLVELRGWSRITLPAVHTRDVKIYLDDPGLWIVGMAAEVRYVVRVTPEVCLVDLNINYVNCSSPPPGAISGKAQREKYRRRLAAAFDSYFHADYSIPSEFKEAFPAGHSGVWRRSRAAAGRARASPGRTLPCLNGSTGPRSSRRSAMCFMRGTRNRASSSG